METGDEDLVVGPGEAALILARDGEVLDANSQEVEEGDQVPGTAFRRHSDGLRDRSGGETRFRGHQTRTPERRDAAAIVWILPMPISRARRNAVVETSSQQGIGRRSASQSAAGLTVSGRRWGGRSWSVLAGLSRAARRL